MAELVERVDEEDHLLAVVERGEAIRQRWLHRIATTVCRDPDGRILVHRRPDNVSRFPGQYNWLIGGAVDVGETYETAAARELAEEIGVRTSAWLVFKYLCRGAISPYWLGLHEAAITQPIAPDISEIAWHTWLTEPELRDAIRSTTFVPDAQEAFARYQALTDPSDTPEPSDLGPRRPLLSEKRSTTALDLTAAVVPSHWILQRQVR